MPPKRAVAIVFIHGLAKKPPIEKLKEIWLWALGRDNPMPSVFAPPNRGINLSAQGVPQLFNYYADVFYGIDTETDFKSYYEAADSASELAADGIDGAAMDLAPPEAVTPREQKFLREFQLKLQASAVMTALPLEGAPATDSAGDGGSDYEIASWLPDFAKQAIMKKAAMEAFYFLFNKEYVRTDGTRFKVREELRARLLRELAAAGEKATKIVIVSHSMGTMVAYDVLRNCPECPKVDTLITLGSPLGVQEVQDELVAQGESSVDFPAAKLDHWINVYDPLDPICAADPRLANDFREAAGKRVEDVKESNWGNWRHTITHYLAGTELRKHLTRAIAQP